MLQQNLARNQNSAKQYNGDTYQDGSLMQQQRAQHRMAQSIHMDSTTTQHMYENGHDNTTVGEDNQYKGRRMDNVSNDDSNMIGDHAGGTKRSSPGFETFVMTGDMIIRTSTPDGSKKTSMQKKRKPTSQSHQAGADGDSNKHKVKEKNDAGSGVPKKKVSKIPQSKIPKSGTPAKDAAKEKKKSPVSRIPKVSSSSSGGGSRDSSPKSSPKNSPKKTLSKLPQLQGSTVRSPVLSKRQSSSGTKTELTQIKPLSPRQQVRHDRETINNNRVVESSNVMNDNNVSRQSDAMDVDPNGSISTSARMVPKTPSLSSDGAADYSSFCVVPQASPSAYPELDIPPDDITSEDSAYQNMDAFVNLEDLPPPPDDLLCDDKSASLNDTDQVVPEAGGFLPIYSPSEITRQNHFRLDSTVLQTAEAESAPPPPPPPVCNSSQQLDTDLISQHQMETSPVSQPPLLEDEDQSLVDLPAPLAEFARKAERIEHAENELQEAVENMIQALEDHSYSMLPQDSDFINIHSHEENLLNNLEHGSAECDLEMQVESDTISKNAQVQEEFNHKPIAEVFTDKQPMSRIPVMKSNNNSVRGVRNSKSHENYLESSNVDPSLQCVNIDFEDDIATSVDVLHYQEQSASQCAERQSKSLDNSPERSSDKHSEKILMPTFINIEEPRSIGRLKEGGRLKDMTEIRQSVGEPKVGYHVTKSQKDTNAEVNGASYNPHVITFDRVGESSTDPEEMVGSVPQQSQKEPVLEKCDDGIWLSIGVLKDALSTSSSPQHSAHSDTSKHQHQAEINYSGASNNIHVVDSGACAGGSQPSHTAHESSPSRVQHNGTTTDNSPSQIQQEQQQQHSYPHGSPGHAQQFPDNSTVVVTEDGTSNSGDRLLGGAGNDEGMCIITSHSNIITHISLQT